MTESVVRFYTLTQKFLDTENVPDKAQQVVYYSLSIGHHVGIIDCLTRVMEFPKSGYEQWIAQLPEGEAHRKMAGLLKFGEITIDKNHTQLLAKAFAQCQEQQTAPFAEWTETLMQVLQAIEQEPAMYLMVKVMQGRNRGE